MKSLCILTLQAYSGLFCSFKDGIKYVSIFVQRGEEWKKSRQLISPAFSAHKMKMVKTWCMHAFRFSIVHSQLQYDTCIAAHKLFCLENCMQLCQIVTLVEFSA